VSARRHAAIGLPAVTASLRRVLREQHSSMWVEHAALAAALGGPRREARDGGGRVWPLHGSERSRLRSRSVAWVAATVYLARHLQNILAFWLATGLYATRSQLTREATHLGDQLRGVGTDHQVVVLGLDEALAGR
jgi:hypothetical protein